MERQTRVAVYESEKSAEIQLMKLKLNEAGIETFVQNSFMTFITTPTATTLQLQVDLADEPKAFEIIDAYLQQENLVTNN